MNQPASKFIYFDVGGVAVVDFSGNDKWNQMISELGIPEEKREEFRNLWKKGEGELCIGSKSTEELAGELAEKIGFELEPGYRMLDDFVARFERNAALCDLLDKIKDNYRFGLLTNMYPGMLDKIVEAKLLPDVKWDVVIDSTIVKMQKPNQDIYKYAQELTNLAPEEILFVENTEGNLIIPKELGWQTFLYNSYENEKSVRYLSEIIS